MMPSPAALVFKLETLIKSQDAMLTATEAALGSLEQFLAAARIEHTAMVALRDELLARMLPSRES